VVVEESTEISYGEVMRRRRSPHLFVLRREEFLVRSENPSTFDVSRKRGISNAAILDRYRILVYL